MAQSVPGRVPTSFGLAVGDLLEKVFMSNSDGGEGGTIVQVKNAEGKRLFMNEATKEVDWDHATGLRTMMPFFPSNGDGKKIPFEVYYICRDAARQRSPSRPARKGSHLPSATIGIYHIQDEEANAKVTLAVHGIGTNSPSVNVKEVRNRSRATSNSRSQCCARRHEPHLRQRSATPANDPTSVLSSMRIMPH
jgi:hypothetical protein